MKKKHVSNRKPGNNYTRRNKSWFDLDCKTLRRNSIITLRNFRLAKTHDALDTYKHIKTDSMAMIKVKKICILSIKATYYLLQQMINIQKHSGTFSKQSESPKFSYRAG